MFLDFFSLKNHSIILIFNITFENGHTGILLARGQGIRVSLSFLQREVPAISAVRNLVPLKAIILCCANILEITTF